MSRFGSLMIVTVAALLCLGDIPSWAKGGRHASHGHRHHGQRSHKAHHKHKVHPKNPTRRPKHKPKHPVKHHPRPRPGKHPKAPPKRTVMPRVPHTPKLPPSVAKPKTPAEKPRERARNVRTFVNFNDRTREYWFDNHWWYNFVVYPTTVSRSEAFTANYHTIVPPPNVTVKPPVVKATEGLPIAPAGSSLAVLLDRMDVEHRWLPGQVVAWRTGEAVDGSARGPISNAGSFVAAVCAELKVPMLPPTAANLSPVVQYDWLLGEGPKKGWVEVGSLEAQLLANQGWVVLAAWRDGAANAHAAVVRPSRRPAGDISPNGPRITEAGLHNYSDISLKDGFPPKAWAAKQVVFLAHRPG
jgi:hypothetical protein